MKYTLFTSSFFCIFLSSFLTIALVSDLFPVVTDFRILVLFCCFD